SLPRVQRGAALSAHCAPWNRIEGRQAYPLTTNLQQDAQRRSRHANSAVHCELMPATRTATCGPSLCSSTWRLSAVQKHPRQRQMNGSPTVTLRGEPHVRSFAIPPISPVPARKLETAATLLLYHRCAYFR